jgi:hypothetical protein
LKPAPRTFTPADKSLIRTLHPHLPIADLLKLLNDRLVADVGPTFPKYTVDQLHAELKDVAPTSAAGAENWSGLRRVLAQARRDGVLARLSPQLVEDFCVVFQLTAAQRTHVLDTVRHAKEER